MHGTRCTDCRPRRQSAVVFFVHIDLVWTLNWKARKLRRWSPSLDRHNTFVGLLSFLTCRYGLGLSPAKDCHLTFSDVLSLEDLRVGRTLDFVIRKPAQLSLNTLYFVRSTYLTVLQQLQRPCQRFWLYFYWQPGKF